MDILVIALAAISFLQSKQFWLSNLMKLQRHEIKKFYFLSKNSALTKPYDNLNFLRQNSMLIFFYVRKKIIDFVIFNRLEFLIQKLTLSVIHECICKISCMDYM